MVNKQRLVRSFLELIKIDSVSRHEQKFSHKLVIKLKKLGLKVKLDKKGNILSVLPGNKKNGKTLLFNAHMDTVVPGINIKPKIVGGKIISDGSTVLGADDKAGIAAILEMLALVKQGKIVHGDIKVIFTVEEEIGLRGARALSRKDVLADHCFVLDAHGDVGTIVNKSPAQDSIDIRIKGKAAHAGICPEEGINAIQVASRAIAKIRLGRIDKETTANIGVISGGVATNIIPEDVHLRGEARSHDPKKLKEQVELMARAFRSEAQKAGASALIKVERSYNSVAIAENAPIIALTKIVAKALKFPHRIVSSGGGSDANIFFGHGIPTIALAIGMENVHSKQEYITIKNLCDAALFILEIVKMGS